MKNSFAFVILVLLVILTSCSQRVPYTDSLRDQYDLTPLTLKKVQFYTSAQIILHKSTGTGTQRVQDGKLVLNETSSQDRIIINPSTKCIFEKDGEAGEIYIRFEQGTGKFLKFAVRKNQTSGRYYLVADWNKNGLVNYANTEYTINSASGNAFLMVSIKKLTKSFRKDRVVKGLKV